MAAVRAAVGPDVELRLDANGAWSVEEAQRMIEALAPAGLELVEEPVRGIAATRRLRELVAVRIAIDETAALPGALTGGVADVVCLKIARCGGISGLLAAAAAVRASAPTSTSRRPSTARSASPPASTRPPRWPRCRPAVWLPSGSSATLARTRSR